MNVDYDLGNKRIISYRMPEHYGSENVINFVIFVNAHMQIEAVSIEIELYKCLLSL